MPPIASPTESSPRISSRSDASTGGGGGFSKSAEKLASLPLTTTSVPAYESEKMLENALSIVSVRT